MQKTQAEFSWKENSLNKILKNKFILIIIAIIISIIWLGIYSSSTDAKDRSSYVVLINWNWTLNTIPLKTNEKELLQVWDTVKTLWNNSLAILEWWDGSVTRLWWNTTVKIDNLYLSNNLDKINISFKLLSWKSWSTVISFLGEDSYFNEYFRDNVAAVRWTVFDIDLDNDYLYVIDHKVNVTKKGWESFIVEQNKPLNLKTFDFIALEEFLKSFKDKAWEKLNKQIDNELFKWLQDQIYKNLDELVNINDLNIDWVINEQKKKELYNRIIEDYQKLNFVKPDNEELFKKKIELKEALIKLSSNENKSMLIQNTFYDFNNVINSKNYKDLDILLPILWENKDLLNSLNFNKVVNLNSLSEDMQNKLSDLQINLFEARQNIDTKIKDSLNDGFDLMKASENIDTKIKESLNKWLNLINN